MVVHARICRRRRSIQRRGKDIKNGLEAAEGIGAKRKLAFIDRGRVVVTSAMAPVAGSLADVPGARRRRATRTIDLLGVTVDEGLHAHRAHVKHVTGSGVGGASAGLGGAADAAAAAADAWWQNRRRDTRVVML